MVDAYHTIRYSRLFDKEWFCETYSLDSSVDPINYFLENCEELGLNPSTDFDSLWYLKKNRDVVASGMNPLLHYILHGSKEGRLPKPFYHDLKYKNDYLLILNSNLFDKNWFCEKYSVDSNLDPIIYYLDYWDKLGLDPSEEFDSKWYLSEYGDVANSNMNPLIHYLVSGKKENRLPKQDSMRNLVNTVVEINFSELDDMDLIMDERYGLIVHYKNVKYDFLIDMKSNSSNVFVFASGVIPPDEYYKFYNRPVFKRQSWDLKPEVTESTIFFNDPTRYTYKELRGGWGIGTPDDYYLEDIALILSKIFELYNYKNENVIFYSSSMGGFMSIQLATMLPGTVAWADIPQTDLDNFVIYKDWEVIFENENIGDYKDRYKCIEFIKKSKTMPKIFLNIDCYIDDLANQFYPFINGLQNLDFYNPDDFKIMINPIEDHQFLLYEEFVALKNAYFSKSNDFDKIPFLSVLNNNSVLPLIKENDIDERISDLIHNIITSDVFENYLK